VRCERIGPLGLLAWFRDDWLVTRLAIRLFFLATLIVLALTPIVYGWVRPNPTSFWSNLGWGILGVVGPIALFFLLFGMWRYWLRVDDSRRWAKRFWFLMLLVGIWWWYALCLYCWIVYLPKVIRVSRTGIQTTPASALSPSQQTNIAFRPGIFGKILISCWVLFFGGLLAALLLLKPGKASVWFPNVETLRIFSIVLVLTSIAYGIRWLYALGMKR
jgi:hypothetical protein